MKNKLPIKIMLDILMAIIFLLLMNPSLTGLIFHEIVGIIILLSICIHLVLNGTWIEGMFKNLKNKNLNTKSKLILIINILLFIIIIIVSTTGILISKFILTSFTANNIQLVSSIHKISAITCFGLVAIHLGLHLEYMINAIKHIKTNFYIYKKSIAKCTLIIAIIIAIYIPISKLISNSSSNLNTAFNTSEQYGSNSNENNQFNKGVQQAQEAIEEYSNYNSTSNIYFDSDSPLSDL